MTGIIWCEQQA